MRYSVTEVEMRVLHLFNTDLISVDLGRVQDFGLKVMPRTRLIVKIVGGIPEASPAVLQFYQNEQQLHD